jgi:hypothetical protein
MRRANARPNYVIREVMGMAIHYHCRHCGMQIGSLNQISIDSERLGIHTLTDEERRDLIAYQSNGDIAVKSICEDCHESLERNPEYYQNEFIIH